MKMKLTRYYEIGYCIVPETITGIGNLNESEILLNENSESADFHNCRVIYFPTELDGNAKIRMATLASKSGNKVILNNWFRFTSSEFTQLTNLARESGAGLLFGFNSLEPAYLAAAANFTEHAKYITARLELKTNAANDLLYAMLQALLFARAISKVEFRKITGKVLCSGNQPFLFKVETENLNGDLGSFTAETAEKFNQTIVLRGENRSLTITESVENSESSTNLSIQEKPYFTTPLSVGVLLKKLQEIWISAGMKL